MTEDELEAHSPEDPLMVEALMGWDGDPCLCDECDCPRFIDGEQDRCVRCRAGDHWKGSE